MTPCAIVVSATLLARLQSPTSIQLMGVGNTALIEVPLLGLMASRECTGHVLLETLERVPQWVHARRIIVSGFHSPLEQQVLRSVLRRKGQVVKVLAHGMQDYRPEPDECEPLATGRMLIITACPQQVKRTTRATALARNRLVVALASELVAPYVAAGSPLESMLAARPQAPART